MKISNLFHAVDKESDSISVSRKVETSAPFEVFVDPNITM